MCLMEWITIFDMLAIVNQEVERLTYIIDSMVLSHHPWAAPRLAAWT
jgi:hypothetical protein